MVERIRAALAETEKQHGVRILYACESGSRAWGFASTDSDYDVRFIYVRPLNDYLTIKEERDVVEAMLPDDIDLAGWDLRKALWLLTKSNPSLFEWLESPIVYSADEKFISEFKQIAARWYSEQRLFLHYLHMAEGNWRGYLQGDTVSHKKYLYVLRPTLACRWIDEGRGVVPMEFARLLSVVEGKEELCGAIVRLIREKASGVELAVGPPNAVLHEFIREELSRFSAMKLNQSSQPERSELDSLFRSYVLATP